MLEVVQENCNPRDMGNYRVRAGGGVGHRFVEISVIPAAEDAAPSAERILSPPFVPPRHGPF